jgi:microcystin-dependent protein
MFNPTPCHFIMKPHRFLLVPLLALVWAGSAFSQTSNVPALMNYQAYITDASGVPLGKSVANGGSGPVDRVVHFRFWNHSTNAVKTAGGNLLFSHSQTVTINEGDFSVLLGLGAAITGDVPIYSTFANVFSSKDVFLGITVDLGGNGIEDDGEVAPRQQLVSTAFAFRAQVAESVDNLAISAAMLATSAVEETNIADLAVTGGKLADQTVTGSKIADGTIAALQLGSNAVTNLKLIDDAVTSEKIKDKEVKTADLADYAVTNLKLGPDAVRTGNILDGQVAMADLVLAVQQALNPPGTIVAYGGNTAPAGWLLCNGQLHSKTGAYAVLYGVIGNNFGNTGGSFNVPDFRGRFLRGRDGGQGRDPDRNSRTAMTTGGNSGDLVGSVQGDQFKAHSHNYNKSYTTADTGSGRAVANWYGDTTPATSSTGGNETRPVNANVNYIIKY